jgi:fructose-specific phosphotransferase system IIC component
MKRQQIIVTLSALAAVLSGTAALYYFAISPVEHGWVYGSIWIVTTLIWLFSVWILTGTAFTIGEIKVLKERNERLDVNPMAQFTDDELVAMTAGFVTQEQHNKLEAWKRRNFNA